MAIPVADSTLRQRPRTVSDAKRPHDKPTQRPAPRAQPRRARGYSPYLDIVRVLAVLCLASAFLSYYLSGGESWLWRLKTRPRLLQVEWWKTQLRGPLVLTLDELAAYDGNDATKPIYLAINGSIYDVTAGRRTYGPGGSYHAFAGCDASRAFVTGCYAQDRSGDMRGVYQMFLPLDDLDADRLYAPADLRALRLQERRDAKQRTHDALHRWVDFFARSTKYHYVGRVARPPGWPRGEPRPALCEGAVANRVKRPPPDAAVTRAPDDAETDVGSELAARAARRSS